ncbi:MAG: hypothetical protein O6762_01515 [Thaumarchaeota archaeon]|nr:hypothetical protein [Nitrososphaerota archaeon]
MGTITYKKKACVIGHYFLGSSRDETSRACDASTGSVSTIWKELEQTIGPEGKRSREMIVDLRKDGHNIPEALQGSKIARSLTQLGVNLNGIESFTDGLYKKSIERGRSPEAVAESACKLIEIEEESKLSYESILLKIKEGADTLARIKQELADIKIRVIQTMEEEQSAIKEKHATRVSLERYVRVREGLKPFGVDIDLETEKAANIFSNLKEQDYDIKRLLREAGNHRSLAKEDGDLIKSIETHLVKNQEYSSRLDNNKEICSELDMVKRLGFTTDFLKELGQTLLRIGSARNLSPHQMIEKFLGDLKEYDEKVGYGYQVEKANSELETVQSGLKLENAKFNALLSDMVDTKEVISSIKSLGRRGVKKESIVSWEEALAKGGVTLDDLKGEVEDYGSLKKAITHNESKLSQLESEERRRKATIEILKESEVELRQSMKIREQELVARMRRLEKEELRIGENVVSGIKSLRANGLKSIQRIEDETTAKFGIWNTLMDRMAEEMKEYGYEKGKMEIVKPIIDLLQGDELAIDPRKLEVTMLLVMERYRLWIDKRRDINDAFVSSSLDSFLGAMRDRGRQFGN